MGVVVHPKGFGGGSDHELREKVDRLSNKIDNLVAKLDENNEYKKVENGEFALYCKANLVWWSNVDDAARYRVLFSINGDKVDAIDLGRETRYYAFAKLPKGITYTVTVIAENREGNEIVSATIEL